MHLIHCSGTNDDILSHAYLPLVYHNIVSVCYYTIKFLIYCVYRYTYIHNSTIITARKLYFGRLCMYIIVCTDRRGSDTNPFTKSPYCTIKLSRLFNGCIIYSKV